MNPLALPQPEYKAVFERITQVALEYLASIDERPSFPAVSGSNTEALFSKPLSENGIGIAALNELSAVIDGLRPGGPRFFGYVMGSGEPVAAAADLLASVLNQNVTAWRSGPSAATLERVVVGWLAEAIGCKGFRGSLTGGGSPANLMGLAMAREINSEMTKKVWYALRVQSEREEKIKESLLARVRAKGLEHFISRIVVPAENVSEIKEGKKRVSQQKMFPGYILIEVLTGENGEVSEGLWFAIMETPGISGFVGDRTKPSQLDDEEVQRILSDIESRKEKPKPKVEFEPGNKVRIKEGPFENFDGTVESVDSTKWMLKVKVSIFGRDTSVEMDYSKVEKI